MIQVFEYLATTWIGLAVLAALVLDATLATLARSRGGGGPSRWPPGPLVSASALSAGLLPWLSLPALRRPVAIAVGALALGGVCNALIVARLPGLPLLGLPATLRRLRGSWRAIALVALAALVATPILAWGVARWSVPLGGEGAGLALASVILPLVVLGAWLGRLEPVLIAAVALGVGDLWASGGLAGQTLAPNPWQLAGLAISGAFGLQHVIVLLSVRLEDWRRGTSLSSFVESGLLVSALLLVACCVVLLGSDQRARVLLGQGALVGLLGYALGAQLLVPALSAAILRRRGPSGTPRLGSFVTSAWVFAVLVGPALWFLLVRRWFSPPGEPRRRAARAAFQRMGRRIWTKLPMGRRRYRDARPTLEPGLVVSNHGSIFDVTAIAALHPIVVLVKSWVWKTPLMGSFVRASGYINVDLLDPAGQLEAARQAIAEGAAVLIFPEGRRTRTGKLGRFRNGAFALARELGLPLQLVALVDNHNVSRADTWWVSDHDVLLSALPPLDPAEFQHDDLPDRRMAQAARRAIRDAQRELRRDTQRGPEWQRPIANLYRYLGPVVSHYAPSKLKRDPLVVALPELIPGPGEVLVAGCGLGLMTARLALADPERGVRAIDLDERKLELARAALGEEGNVTFQTGDLRQVDLGNPFAVLLVDVLHYWPPETQRELVSRLAHALQPGGLLLFRDGVAGEEGHSGVHWGEAFATGIGFTRAGDALHFQSEAEYRGLLEAAGLEIEETRSELGLGSNLVLVCRKAAEEE